MRVHLSKELNAVRVRPENKMLLNMLHALQRPPMPPDWAQPVDGYPNRYEFNGSGLWVQFVIDASGMETVIYAALAGEFEE